MAGMVPRPKQWGGGLNKILTNMCYSQNNNKPTAPHGGAGIHFHALGTWVRSQVALKIAERSMRIKKYMHAKFAHMIMQKAIQRPNINRKIIMATSLFLSLYLSIDLYIYIYIYMGKSNLLSLYIYIYIGMAMQRPNINQKL